MRAELAWREGDWPRSARCCLEVLAAFETYQAIWWEPLRARIRARLAMAVLAQGDAGRCRELLAAALDAAAAWTEHPALAAVLDACACYVLRPAGLALAAPAVRTAHDDDPAHVAPAQPPPPMPPAVRTAHGDDPAHRPAATAVTAERAEVAARLLGAAHAVRGAFDESSLDAPPARDAARAGARPGRVRRRLPVHRRPRPTRPPST